MQLSVTRFYKLMDEPLVCVIASGSNFASGIFRCLKEAKGRHCHVLVICCWHVPDIAKAAVLFKRQAAKEYPNLHLTYLCPTNVDAQFLQSLGVDALHVSHNALLDEKLLKQIANETGGKYFRAKDNAGNNRPVALNETVCKKCFRCILIIFFLWYSR